MAAMDEGGATTNTRIYCRGCDYDLRASATRCPECGRAFDRNNPKSYHTSPRSWRVRRWVRRIVLLILLMLLPPGLELGWLWWGWKQEQKGVAAVKAAGGTVMSSEPLYPWLPKCLPARWAFLTERAAVLDLHDDRGIVQ